MWGAGSGLHVTPHSKNGGRRSTHTPKWRLGLNQYPAGHGQTGASKHLIYTGRKHLTHGGHKSNELLDSDHLE